VAPKVLLTASAFSLSELDQLQGQASAAWLEGNLPKAVRLFKKYIRLAPRDYAAHKNLAQLYTEQHDSAKAVHMFRLAAELNNELEDWYSLRSVRVLNPWVAVRMPLCDMI